jgi:hypothetical protein
MVIQVLCITQGFLIKNFTATVNHRGLYHQEIYSFHYPDTRHLQRNWFSGKILRCHPQRRGALGSIPRLRITISFCLCNRIYFFDFKDYLMTFH